MSTISKLFAGVFILTAFYACQSHQTESKNNLGILHFDVTGQPDALADFNKGMLLLHSFEYEDAAESFSEALKKDSAFVMAYWGKAMTETHPLWQEQEYEKGNEILSVLAPTAEERVTKAQTALEKDFIRAINIMYGGGNKAERDSSYAAWMGTLYTKYTGNDEVAAFYSLALNGWGTTEPNDDVLEKAAKVAFEVLDRNPQHPGALHYIIHAYDNPLYAAKALEVADRYAKVAPDAGHALHMPTHTYVALGKWDKVISSNEVSWAAEQDRKKRKNLDNDALGYHAYHWLQYGLLQTGNKERARSMVDSMLQFCTAKPSSRARSHMLLLKTTYLAETNDYSQEVVGITVDTKDLNLVTRARNNFVMGMNAYQQQNPEEMHAIILMMATDRLLQAEKITANGLRVCGNINRSLPTKEDVRVAEVMELELKAMEASLKKDNAATEKFLKQATAMEALSGTPYGPPRIVKPSYELYGEWLLENNRNKDAVVQFENSLKNTPNRRLSLQGKSKAENSKATASL